MLYLQLIIFLVGGDVIINNETFLMIDFINLKIKLALSFKNAHKNMIYVYIFIKVSAHTYIIICVYTII
jgi:hypothetical protein